MGRLATDVRVSPTDPPVKRVRARSLVRAARPKQWAKNVLVFAAPGAAGVLSHGDVLVDTALADPCHQLNPRACAEADMVALYAQAL